MLDGDSHFESFLGLVASVGVEHVKVDNLKFRLKRRKAATVLIEELKRSNIRAPWSKLAEIMLDGHDQLNLLNLLQRKPKGDGYNMMLHQSPVFQWWQLNPRVMSLAVVGFLGEATLQARESGVAQFLDGFREKKKTTRVLLLGCSAKLVSG